MYIRVTKKRPANLCNMHIWAFKTMKGKGEHLIKIAELFIFEAFYGYKN